MRAGISGNQVFVIISAINKVGNYSLKLFFQRKRLFNLSCSDYSDQFVLVTYIFYSKLQDILKLQPCSDSDLK